MVIKPKYWEQAKNELSDKDFVMAGIIKSYDGEYLESRGDAFYSLARSIVGQQVSVKAADSIWNKLESVIQNISPDIILKTEHDNLRSAGLSNSKVTYLKNVAEYFISNQQTAENFHLMSDNEITAELMAIKGIGRWTVEMFLIFHMLRPDVFPVKDIGLQKAIIKHYDITEKVNEGKFLKLSNSWSPWRTVATWYLWRSLDPVPVKY